MTINFTASARDRRLISQIASRAVALGEKHGSPVDSMSCTMDIAACHLNGNPLRLRDLLDADDFNFTHDVFGIERHLDRTTGKLDARFSPRFSQRSAVAA